MTIQKVEKQIIGITGHRKLVHEPKTIKEVVRERLYQLGAGCVVTGMALGFDMLVAEVCVAEEIPFVAAIPCRGQTEKWITHEKNRWINLMEKAWKHKIVSPGPYKIWKLFERNKWIVNRSNIVLAYWNGTPKGGTYHCVDYAKKQGLLVENIYHACSADAE